MKRRCQFVRSNCQRSLKIHKNLWKDDASLFVRIASFIPCTPMIIYSTGSPTIPPYPMANSFWHIQHCWLKTLQLSGSQDVSVSHFECWPQKAMLSRGLSVTRSHVCLISLNFIQWAHFKSQWKARSCCCCFCRSCSWARDLSRSCC